MTGRRGVERLILGGFLAACLLLGIGAQIARVHYGKSDRLFDGDGFFYYAYLPNLFFQHDLDFSEAYARYWPEGPMWSRIVPETGRWSNVWSIGPALLWAPGFLLGHLVWQAARLFGRAGPTDGFDLYHEGGAALMSIAWSLLAIYLTYRLARKVAAPLPAAVATVAVWAGTPLLAYGFLEIDMSHGAGALAAAGLLLGSIAAKRNPHRARNWLACGVLGGLAALVRSPHAVLTIIPLGVWLWETRNAGKAGLPRNLAYLLLLLAAAAVVFIPQMLAWKALFGHYLLNPHPHYFAVFTVSRFWDSLFSLNRGFFTWTPLWALALVGIFLLPKEARWLGGLIGLALLLEMIVNAWALDWSGGEAFGARRLIELGPGLALGLAALLSRLRTPRQALAVGGLAAVLVCWNLALMGLYYSGIIPHVGALPAG